MIVIFAICLIIAIIAETTLLPFPLTLLIIMFSLTIDEENTSVYALLAGLLLDLFALRLLGVSSLFFLGLCLIKQKYGQKISFGSWMIQLPYFLLAVIVYSYLFYHYINIWYLTTLASLGFLLFGLFKPYLPKENDKKRLKVE